MPRLASTSLTRRVRRVSASGWLRLAVLGCAVVAVTLALVAHAMIPSSARARALIGQPAPSFTLAAAQDERTLSQPVAYTGRSGRATLLVFFNTLCVHCAAGVQAASIATADQSSADVLYLDTPAENAQITGQYMTRLEVKAPALLDSGASVASRYGVALYPTLVLVDARGIVRAVWVGPPTVDMLRAAIVGAADQRGALFDVPPGQSG